MEDASSVDLDWFWRGWFYTNDHVDLALSDIQWYQISTGDPDVEKPLAKAEKDAEPVDIALVRDETYIPESRLEARPELNDHYTTVDPFAVMEIERRNTRTTWRPSTRTNSPCCPPASTSTSSPSRTSEDW